MQRCIAVFHSMTQALGAQRALSRAAIHASIVRLDARQTAHGCAYGLEFSCVQEKNVRTVLGQSGISVKEYIGG
jgi:hypothetical protein